MGGRLREGPASSRAFEALAIGFAAVGMLCLALEAAVLRRFEKMFADFGGALPAPTQFVFDVHLPHLAFAVAAVLVGVAGMLVRFKASRTEGRVVLVVAAGLSWLAVGFCALAMYVPFWSPGGAIK